MAEPEIPIPNKTNEPPFRLHLDPPGVIKFVSDRIQTEEVKVEMTIKNTTEKRQCYKVKSTSNAFFRVRPPLGFVEAGNSGTIQFCFKASKQQIPDAKRHVFVITHVPCSMGATNPSKVWSEANPEGARRLAVRFESKDGKNYAFSEPPK